MSKGDNWMADRLKRGREPAWGERTTTRFDWRDFGARLVEPAKPKTFAEQLADDRYGARQEMSESLTLDLLSVCVRGRDLKHRGRLVESWIRGAMLRRIIGMVKPRREGFSHDKYAIAMALLCQHGIAQPDKSGANGYTWTEEYKHMRDRAAWLMAYVKRAGEMRRLAGHSRYEVDDD